MGWNWLLIVGNNLRTIFLAEAITQVANLIMVNNHVL